MMQDSLNIVLAGVGGQGTLVAGKLLGAVAIRQGLDVKVSEVHGMAQRGGSVITYVRMGSKVHSPIVEAGKADFILAFEKLEALRWTPLLKKEGTILINDQEIMPMTVTTGLAQYPATIVETLQNKLGDRARVYAFNALQLAVQSGSNRAVNVVMAGALSVLCGFEPEVFDQAIEDVIKPEYRKINHAALAAGSAIMKAGTKDA